MESMYTTSITHTEPATYFAAQLEQFDKDYYVDCIAEHGVDRPLMDDIVWYWQDSIFADRADAEEYARDNDHKHIIKFTMDDLRAAYIRAFGNQ